MADHQTDDVPAPSKSRRLFKQHPLTPLPTKVVNLVRTAASAEGDLVILQVKLTRKVVDRCAIRAKRDGITLNQMMSHIITESVKATKK
jgi:hypothetical protein